MSSLTFIKRLIGLMVMGVFLLSSTVVLSESEFVVPGSQAADPKSKCVAPTPEMRSHHMVHLTHDRSDVVRDGDRSVDYSLVKCVNCHAATDSKGTAIPVNAEGQFCSSCHEKVAVSMPCFDCHRKIPEAK